MIEKEYEHFMRSLSIMRNVTLLVKVFPFIYTLALIATMICYRYCSEEVCTFMDMMFFFSPLTCLFLITLSYLLKMCIWHRLQCLLPLSSFIVVILDTFYDFSIDVFYIDNTLFIVIPLLSLFNGYRIFFCSK